jgi:hypothetical protein
MPLHRRILQEANGIGNAMYMLTCKAETGVIKLIITTKLFSRSRMKGDFHVRFWSRGMNGNIYSTVTLSHPGAVSGSKGLAVRQRTRYMI